MLAKVIAWAPDRASALRMLGAALRRARVHTDLLEQRRDDWSRPRTTAADRQGYATAAALAEAATSQATARVQARIPAAYRNVPSRPRIRTYLVGEEELTASYSDVHGRLQPVEQSAVAVAPTRVVLEDGGVRRTYTVAVTADGVDVDGPGGSVFLARVPRFTDPADTLASGSLVAPMPVVVVAVSTGAGEQVSRGQPVVVLEAMKMQHTIQAPHDGLVTDSAVTVGQQVEAGAVLAVVDPAPERQAEREAAPAAPPDAPTGAVPEEGHTNAQH